MTEADIAGVPTAFEWRGRIFQVCPRTLAMEFAFSTWLQEQTVRLLRRHREALGAEGYEQGMKVWMHDVASGAYEFGGPLTYAALQSLEGLREMLYLKMRLGMDKHGGAPVDRELVRQISQDREAWDTLINVLFRQDFPDPNPKGPEGEQPSQPAGE
jgi:hypothetical protein